MLTEQEMSERLQAVQKIKVELDASPESNGLPSLNKKISEIQENKNYLNALLVESIENKTRAQVIFETKKTKLQMELDGHMVNTDSVKGQKNAEARKSAANVEAHVLVLEEHNARIEYMKATSYQACIRQHYDNIESAFQALSRQITVLQLDSNLMPKRNNLDTQNPKPIRVTE
jgi:hypothetical protein